MAKKNSDRHVNQLKFEYVSTDKLIPFARNARKHSNKQIKEIAASIKQFGFLSPVVIAEDGGILAGHGRVLAAKMLKLPSVPTVEASHLTSIQKQAFILVDNQASANSSWDDELYRVHIEELKVADIDLSALGFDLAMNNDFEPNLPPEENSDRSPSKFILIITLKDAEQQETLFGQLNSEGYKVKVG